MIDGVFALCALVLQQKAFEAEVVESLGYKSAIAAADELRGLLEGSKTAPRKGMPAEQQALYSSLPQVRRVDLSHPDSCLVTWRWQQLQSTLQSEET